MELSGISPAVSLRLQPFVSLRNKQRNVMFGRKSRFGFHLSAPFLLLLPHSRFYGFDFMPVSVSIMSKPIVVHSEGFGISTVPSPDETLNAPLAFFVIVLFDFILE